MPILNYVKDSVLILDNLATNKSVGMACENLIRYISQYGNAYGFLFVDDTDHTVYSGIMPAIKDKTHTVDVDGTLVEPLIPYIKNTMNNLNTPNGLLYTSPIPQTVFNKKIYPLRHIMGRNRLIGIYRRDDDDLTIVPIMLVEEDSMIDSEIVGETNDSEKKSV